MLAWLERMISFTYVLINAKRNTVKIQVLDFDYLRGFLLRIWLVKWRYVQILRLYMLVYSRISQSLMQTTDQVLSTINEWEVWLKTEGGYYLELLLVNRKALRTDYHRTRWSTC